MRIVIIRITPVHDYALREMTADNGY